MAFDIIMFTLDNLETLTYDYNILATYFPNILKVTNKALFVLLFLQLLLILKQKSVTGNYN